MCFKDPDDFNGIPIEDLLYEDIESEIPSTEFLKQFKTKENEDD